MMPNLRAPESRHKRSLPTEAESLHKQLSKIQEEQTLLRNVLSGLARESDMSIGTACPKCEKSYMLIKRGLMSCPSCSNRISI
jgi:hypothetical protein